MMQTPGAAALAAAALLLGGCADGAEDVTTPEAEQAYFNEVTETIPQLAGHRGEVVAGGRQACRGLRDSDGSVDEFIWRERQDGLAEDRLQRDRAVLVAAIEYLCPDLRDRL